MGPYESSLHAERQARMHRMAMAAVQCRAFSNFLPDQPATEKRWFPEGFTLPDADEYRPKTSAEKIRNIIRLVGCEYDVTETDIISERRSAPIILPRQVAMYLCKKTTTYSLPRIGGRFGGRDHTTVLHAVRKIERLLPIDPELAVTVAYLEAQLTQ